MIGHPYEFKTWQKNSPDTLGEPHSIYAFIVEEDLKTYLGLASAKGSGTLLGITFGTLCMDVFTEGNAFSLDTLGAALFLALFLTAFTYGRARGFGLIQKMAVYEHGMEIYFRRDTKKKEQRAFLEWKHMHSVERLQDEDKHFHTIRINNYYLIHDEEELEEVWSKLKTKRERIFEADPRGNNTRSEFLRYLRIFFILGSGLSFWKLFS